eukprot:3083696-Rhodomonas_salina.1
MTCARERKGEHQGGVGGCAQRSALIPVPDGHVPPSRELHVIRPLARSALRRQRLGLGREDVADEEVRH